MEIDCDRVLDALPAMVLTALPDGHIDFVNRRWNEYTGLALGAGHRWEWPAVVDPEDLSGLLARWRSIVASDQPGDIEARLRRSDGQYRWFLIQCSPIRDEAGRIVKWYGLSTDVDDLRRAEDKLRRRELDFQLIVDSIPVPVAVTTPSGEVEGLNQLNLDYFGKTFEELRGWKASEVVHPDDLEQTAAAQLKAHQTSSEYNVESRHLRADGVYRWHNVRGFPLRDHEGAILRWFHLLIDIDDRKRAEETLRQSEARLADAERDLRLTIDTIPAFVVAYQPDGSRSFVNRTWQDYVGLAPGEVTGPDATTFPHFHPDDAERTDNAWRASLASGEPLSIEVRVRRADGQYRWHTMRRVPLRDDEGNIVRWHAVGVDIDDQKQAEGALLASERDARLVVDSIPGLVAVFAPNGEVEAVNQQVLDYFGSTEEEQKSWATGNAVDPEDLPRAIELFSRSLASGEPFEFEVRARRFDGMYRWLQSRGFPLRDTNGRIVRWYNLLIDIEDRKRAEQAVAASERNLKLIIDTIPALAWSAGNDGAADFFNQHYLRYIGLSAEQAQGWGWAAAVHQDDMNGLAAVWQAALASGTSGEAEARMRRFDGEYRWFLFRVDPLRDETGAIVKWYGVNTDIDDRKRAEEALRARERDLGRIINTIPVMAWTSHPDGSAEFFNQHYLNYVGLSVGHSHVWNSTAEVSRYWDLTAAVHPDDVNGLVATWQAILASGHSGETEARLRRFDGKYRWFLFRANPLRDESGDIIKWYSTNTDIDDRKRAEEALRESESQSRLIVDTIPGLVAVFGPNGEVDALNKQFLGYLGQTKQEFASWPTNGTVHPEDLQRHMTILAGSLASGDPIDFETRLRRFDGAYRWFQLRGHPARGADGRIVRWYCLMSDIDDRKRAEEELQRSEAFLAEGQYLARMGSLSWRVATGEIIWSEHLYRIYEFEPDTPVTLELIASRVHPEDLPLMADMVQRAQRGENDFEYKHRIILPDLSVKYLHLIGHRARENTEQVEYVGAVLDITQGRLAEEALERVRSELAHVTRIVSLGVLTASIAHEVNQPLSGIITNAGTCLRMLAADPPNIDGARETARRTIRDGNRAADVIARLRALFSRRAAAIEPVDLNEAALEVIALLSSDLQRSRVVLRTELADGLAPVGGDRVQLQQVIMNLLRNAADAMSDVDDRPRRLSIRTEADENSQVRLSVRDAGVGFGDRSTERVFEAFYTTKSDGMGIGLSVSRSIVESHNGRLWARANDGPGATFTFSIPEYSGDEISTHKSGAGAPMNSSDSAVQ